MSEKVDFIEKLQDTLLKNLDKLCTVNLEENDVWKWVILSQPSANPDIHSLMDVINLHRSRNYLLKKSNTSSETSYQLEFSTLEVFS